MIGHFDEAAYLVPRILQALRQVDAPSFLTVLKRFGKGNSSPLSFPIPGWTLAADVPASVSGLYDVLDKLDTEIAEAGGRLYLAKDSRQSAKAFQMCYGTRDIFSNHSKINGCNKTFNSDLLERIGIHD